MQDRAQTVIVGAGIVGASAAYHLAELGQADVLVIDPSTILGSYLVGSDGIAKGVRIATALGRRAADRGVAFEGQVAVTGFDAAGGHVRAVLTDRGRIECERVLICAGIWGPTVG